MVCSCFAVLWEIWMEKQAESSVSPPPPLAFVSDGHLVGSYVFFVGNPCIPYEKFSLHPACSSRRSPDDPDTPTLTCKQRNWARISVANILQVLHALVWFWVRKLVRKIKWILSLPRHNAWLAKVLTLLWAILSSLLYISHLRYSTSLASVYILRALWS